MPKLSTVEEWPFCQEDVTVDFAVQPSKFPVAVTKEDLFKWLYRVKGWRVTANYTYVIDAGDGIDVTVSAVFDFLRSEADETVFVCQSPELDESKFEALVGTWVQHNPFPAPDVTGDLQATARLRIGVVTNDVPVYGISDTAHWYRNDDDENYIPSLLLEIPVFDTVDPTVPFGTVANYIFTGYPGVPSSFTGSIDGNPLTIVLTSPSNSNSLAGTLTIEPYEFWPYDPGDGDGPVWDSATGAELRDPFSC